MADATESTALSTGNALPDPAATLKDNPIFR